MIALFRLNVLAVWRSLALTWYGIERLESRLDTTMLRHHAPVDTAMIQSLHPLLAGGRGLLQVAPGIYLGNKQAGPCGFLALGRETEQTYKRCLSSRGRC